MTSKIEEYEFIRQRMRRGTLTRTDALQILARMTKEDKEMERKDGGDLSRRQGLKGALLRYQAKI